MSNRVNRTLRAGPIKSLDALKGKDYDACLKSFQHDITADSDLNKPSTGFADAVAEPSSDGAPSDP